MQEREECKGKTSGKNTHKQAKATASSDRAQPPLLRPPQQSIPPRIHPLAGLERHAPNLLRELVPLAFKLLAKPDNLFHARAQALLGKPERRELVFLEIKSRAQELVLDVELRRDARRRLVLREGSAKGVRRRAPTGGWGRVREEEGWVGGGGRINDKEVEGFAEPGREWLGVRRSALAFEREAEIERRETSGDGGKAVAADEVERRWSPLFGARRR